MKSESLTALIITIFAYFIHLQTFWNKWEDWKKLRIEIKSRLCKKWHNCRSKTRSKLRVQRIVPCTFLSKKRLHTFVWSKLTLSLIASQFGICCHRHRQTSSNLWSRGGKSPEENDYIKCFDLWNRKIFLRLINPLFHRFLQTSRQKSDLELNSDWLGYVTFKKTEEKTSY